MIVDAWLASADALVGYPMVNARDIVRGRAWATRTRLGRTSESAPTNILPMLDRQLGVAGLQLARFLNDVQRGGWCVRLYGDGPAWEPPAYKPRRRLLRSSAQHDHKNATFGPAKRGA